MSLTFEDEGYSVFGLARYETKSQNRFLFDKIMTQCWTLKPPQLTGVVFQSLNQTKPAILLTKYATIMKTSVEG